MESREFYEDQYSPSRWVKRMDPKDVVDYHKKKCFDASFRSRENLKNETVSYGNKSKENMDIFEPDSAECKSEAKAVFVFVHGGYWQETSKDIYNFLADPLTARGVITAVVGYTLAPEVKIDEMINEIQNAISFLCQKYPEHNLYLCGYSAGAHLCAMMMCLRWDDCSKVPSMIKGMFLVSGVYQLVPLVSTSINEPLKMTKDFAERISPQIILQSEKPSIICPMLLAVGEYESSAFKEMSKSFSLTLKNHGIENLLLTIPKTDHFDIIENLINPDFLLMQLMLKMIC